MTDRITLATCVGLPEPDFDEAPLVGALRQRDLEVAVAAWDDERVDWSQAGLVVLRSTWNYPLKPKAFMTWVETIATTTRMLNSAPVVRWNHHKGYLVELAQAGVPVAATELVVSGNKADLAARMDARGWDDVVVKPAISCGSHLTLRCGASDEGEAHLRALLHQGDALIQAYLPAVETRGERSMIVIDGQLTHAVRKSPRFQGQDESTIPVQPTSAEEAFAYRVLAACPFELSTLAYARVDIAPGPDDELVLMELELIEPSLFLTWGPHNTPASAAALARLVDRLAREVHKTT